MIQAECFYLTTVIAERKVVLNTLNPSFRYFGAGSGGWILFLTRTQRCFVLSEYRPRCEKVEDEGYGNDVTH